MTEKSVSLFSAILKRLSVVNSEEMRASREKEINLLESTGLEGPNFSNCTQLQSWLDWDGEFDTMLKETDRN